MQLTEEELAVVRNIIQQHLPEAKVIAFGSRVKGTAKTYSDLDLALMSDKKIPLDTLFLLQEAFSDSDLIFKVDLIDWHRIDDIFQQHILKHNQKIL